MKLARLTLVALLAVPLSGCIFSVGGGTGYKKSDIDKRFEKIERRLDRIEDKVNLPHPKPEPEAEAEETAAEE